VPVKREVWKEPLTKDYVPHWHCPSCEGGYLKHQPNSLHFSETSESGKAHSDDAWDPDWIEYRFSALLVCNNERCKEPVSVVGRGRVEMVQTSREGDVDYVDFFYPVHIWPSPPLIALPKTYPGDVVSELKKAFVASWSDFPSAANHIRSGVERLLDFLKEPKTRLGTGGRRERLSPHVRIVGMAKRDKELSDSLLAVKWLGNVGSHSDDLSRDDIFDALDILDLTLDDLFVRHRARVKKLVGAINKSKGPARKQATR
jgi:hypothetical protein